MSIRYFSCPVCGSDIEYGRNYVRSLWPLRTRTVRKLKNQIDALEKEIENLQKKLTEEELRRQKERAELHMAGFKEWKAHDELRKRLLAIDVVS